MENNENEIITFLKRIESRLEYLEVQAEYTQAILGSFHPDPVIRDHCQHHLALGVEELYSEATIEKLKAQFPMKGNNDFLRGILKEAIQKLDSVSVSSHQEAF